MSLPLMRQSQAGFTMVELLIVLTIVTVVALLIANNIENTLSKARDVERRNDIDSIQRALEVYWHNNESYPETLNELSVGLGVITDPSGNVVHVIPASDSANKPAHSYKSSKPEAEQAEDESESSEENNLRPAAEYTYAVYDCRVAQTTALENQAEDTTNETSAPETTQATTPEATTPARKCHKYVLYSWLENADEGEIPYEQGNLHEASPPPEETTEPAGT